MNVLSDLVHETLSAPLEWSASRARLGSRVVGVVGADIPLELIVASGSVAVELPTVLGRSTADADRYLESTFSTQSRLIAQQWLDGEFDFIDTVVLSRANDCTQRLYYYLCELQRRAIVAGPRVLVYDLAKIPRAISVAHSVAATRRLAFALGVAAERLPTALADRNRRRRLFDTLDQRRRSLSPPDGAWVQRLLRASDATDPVRFDAALGAWLELAPRPFDGPRLLLVGSAAPDERVHGAVEQAGGRVVVEHGEHSLTRLGAPIATTTDSLDALARHYQALPYGPRSFDSHAAQVTDAARNYRVTGVILWIVEENDSLVWSVPQITHALRFAQVPTLCLTRSRCDSGDGALESIKSFVSGLRSVA